MRETGGDVLGMRGGKLVGMNGGWKCGSERKRVWFRMGYEYGRVFA